MFGKTKQQPYSISLLQLLLYHILTKALEHYDLYYYSVYSVTSTTDATAKTQCLFVFLFFFFNKQTRL